MSIEQVKARIETLKNKYPGDFRVMLSPEDLNKNKLDVLNSEMHGPFDFGDLHFTEIIENALVAGKQVTLQGAGQDKVLVLTGKSGGKLFDVEKSSKDQAISDIRDRLEEMHDRYIGADGVPLLLGGLDSYIYQEKFAGIAKQYGFPKLRSFDMDDSAVLDWVEPRLESKQNVIVIAWTMENRIDVYVERQYAPKSTTPDSISSQIPDVIASGGLNQKLPLISVGLGILGFILICCWGGIPFGIGAMVTGYLGFNNANTNPDYYGGRTLAIAGMGIGAILFLISGILALIALAAKIG